MLACRPQIATRLAAAWPWLLRSRRGLPGPDVAGDEQAGPLDLGGDKSTACTPHKGRGSATYGTRGCKTLQTETSSP